MIYLVSKIIISLLVALGIGFITAWLLQMHLAGRLREQLNSVIFETKSRIPALESEVTNRDQTIDGLREELAQKSKAAPVNAGKANNKEQEQQIDQLRQKVIDLENELRMSRGVVEEDAIFEVPEEDRVETEEAGDLASDDEFFTDIQDIFDDDDSENLAGGAESAPKDTAQSAQDSRKSIEDELQSELEGWGEEESANTAKPTQQAGSVNLKAVPTGMPDTMAADAALAEDETDVEVLRAKIVSLAEARKALSDVVDSQAREMSGLHQKRETQDKSLTVLNQQLELARIANERILRELRDLKDGKPPADDESRSAASS